MLLSTIISSERLSFLFGFVLLIILTSAGIICAQTEVAGEVSGVWDIDGSPYIATDTITVSADDELLIEPGVEVRFEEQVPFLVYGLLRAVGTEEDSVFFRADPENDGVRWYGISLLETDNASIIEYSHISGAGWEGAPQFSRGIFIDRCSVAIRNCLITNCTSTNGAGGIWARYNPNSVIENNSIENNNGGGLWCSGDGITTILGNLIRENIGYGIKNHFLTRSFILNNQIADNTQVGVVINGGCSIIRDNTISGNLGGGINPTGRRTIIKGNVFSGNVTNRRGGGIYIHDGQTIVAGNIFIGNSARRSGGAIAVDSDSRIYSHIYNCIFYQNEAENTGGVYAPERAHVSTQNCVFWNNQDTDFNEYANVEFSIVNEEAGFIDAENGDFRLAENSPCIDAGNPFELYNDADGSRADIGAYGGNDLMFGFGPSIEFPEVGIHAHIDDRITFCNINEDVLTLQELVLSDPENFSVTGEAPIEMPPFEWLEWFEFPIRFNPQQPGEHDATLLFNFENYEPVDQATFALSGTALGGVSGDVSGEWTREMSPIHVIDDISIRGGELLIEPGVEVMFSPDAEIDIRSQCRLTAIGTPDEPILFTSVLDDPDIGDWGGIYLNSGHLDYCVIEFASTGVRLRHGLVEHSTIRNSGIGILLYGSNGVNECWIENCNTGVCFGSPRGNLENSVVVNCRQATNPEAGGRLYHNLIAFCDRVTLSYDYWMQIHFEEWQVYEFLNSEGNIFFRNDEISTTDRPHPNFRYNCIFESPVEGEPLLGDMEFRNLNNTICDENRNIAIDPMLVDPENFDFILIDESPCIDAGNPDWRRDPDGSWADMGAFPFNHDEGDPILTVEPDFIEAEGSSEHAVNLTNSGEGRLWWRSLLEAEWGNCEQVIGVLSQDEDLDLIVTLDELDFEPGIYETELIIDSNDPENPLYAIPITLRIGGENIRAFDVSLREGWNMISLNINPLNCYAEEEERGPDVIRMFEPIIDNTIIAKDEQGRFYAPEFDFNNIPFWNLTEGYLVKVHEDIETNWSGEIIPADTDVPLTEGWNYAAYFPTFELDCSAPDFYVLSPIIDNLIIAKDGHGHFLSTEFEFSNMPPWLESQGYQIKVDADVVLNYPEGREEVAFSAVRHPHLTQSQQTFYGQVRNSDITNKTHESTGRQLFTPPYPPLETRGGVHPTGQNMSLLITSMNEIKTEMGNQIRAYDCKGNLVGMGNVTDDDRCGLAVWGDDETTEHKDGLFEGETFELVYWNARIDAEVKLEAGNVICGNNLEFHVDELVVLDVNANALVPETIVLKQNFPNPFNSVTKITFGLPETTELTLSVFDISGRIVRTLTGGRYKSGYHSFNWDSNTSASGIYFVNLQTEFERHSIKVILVK